MRKEERKICEEVSSSAPDLSTKIKAATNWEKIAETNKGEKRKVFSSVFAFRVAAALCAAIIAIVGAIVLIPLINKGTVTAFAAYDVIIDVNPSVCLSVDENDKVTSQKGLNEDGVILLYKRNYSGMTVGEATKAVISDMEAAGLLTANSKVKVTAIDSKTKKTVEKKREEIAEIIENVFKSDNLSAIYLTDDEIEEIEDYYEKHDLTDYEKTVIHEFKHKLVTLIEEKLAVIGELISSLEAYDKKSDDVIENFTEADAIRGFADKYKYKLEFDADKPTYNDIRDFIEDLEDNAEELKEALEEIDEETDDDDYGDYVEDLLELVREELFHEND